MIIFAFPSDLQLLILFFFSDVWGKFLEFESTCGDLASLVKVENRKLEVYKEVKLAGQLDLDSV